MTNISYNQTVANKKLKVSKPENLKQFDVVTVQRLPNGKQKFIEEVQLTLGDLIRSVFAQPGSEFALGDSFGNSAQIFTAGNNIQLTIDADGSVTLDAIGAVTGTSFDNGTDILTVNLSNTTDETIDLSSLTDSGVNNLSFDSGTNILTLDRNNLPDLTVDLSSLDTSTAGFVQDTRLISTGTGLTGGGDLSADRTISIANSGVDTLQLADLSVSTAKLQDASVTNVKLAASGLDISKFTTGTLDAARLPSTVLLTDTSKTINNNIVITFGTGVSNYGSFYQTGARMFYDSDGITEFRVDAGAGQDTAIIIGESGGNADVQLKGGGANVLQTDNGNLNIFANTTISDTLLVTGLTTHQANVSLNATNNIISMADGLGTQDAVNVRQTIVRDSASEPSLKYKVIEIGDWNMDTTSGVNVLHGIADHDKIRHVSGIIRSDSGSVHYAITPGFSNTTGDFEVAIQGITSTEISINRSTPGLFDSTNFDQTSYNRGWLTILYEA